MSPTAAWAKVTATGSVRAPAQPPPYLTESRAEAVTRSVLAPDVPPSVDGVKTAQPISDSRSRGHRFRAVLVQRQRKSLAGSASPRMSLICSFLSWKCRGELCAGSQWHAQKGVTPPVVDAQPRDLWIGGVDMVTAPARQRHQQRYAVGAGHLDELSRQTHRCLASAHRSPEAVESSRPSPGAVVLVSARIGAHSGTPCGGEMVRGPEDRTLL